MWCYSLLLLWCQHLLCKKVVRHLRYATCNTETSIVDIIHKVIFLEKLTKTVINTLLRVTMNKTRNKNIIQYNSHPKQEHQTHQHRTLVCWSLLIKETQSVKEWEYRSNLHHILRWMIDSIFIKLGVLENRCVTILPPETLLVVTGTKMVGY